jgi:hypothetical protein
VLDAAPPAPLGRLATWAAYALVLALAVLLAVWGAFLVPLRVGTVPLPLSWVVAAVGNAALGRAGGLLLGRGGAVGPGVVWLAVALTLGSKAPRATSSCRARCPDWASCWWRPCERGRLGAVPASGFT